MAGAPDAATTTIVGAACAAVAVVVSSWINKQTALATAKQAADLQERRDVDMLRREADKEAKHDLEMCEITCDRLREDKSVLRGIVAARDADIAFYRGLLVSHNIAIPPGV